jgi:hypothetical protein
VAEITIQVKKVKELTVQAIFLLPSAPCFLPSCTSLSVHCLRSSLYFKQSPLRQSSKRIKISLDFSVALHRFSFADITKYNRAYLSSQRFAIGQNPKLLYENFTKNWLEVHEIFTEANKDFKRKVH